MPEHRFQVQLKVEENLKYLEFNNPQGKWTQNEFASALSTTLRFWISQLGIVRAD